MWGRRDTYSVAAGQRRKKRKLAGQGCEKNVEIDKSPQAEDMSNSRNMDTAAMCSTLQPISTERNAGDNASPSADRASKQSQHTGGQQTFPATMDVHVTQQSGSPV